MALTAPTCDLLDGNSDLLRTNLSLSTSSTSNWVLDKSSFNPKKVSRYSSLKRGKDEVPLGERVKLERILGLTVSSNAALACDPNSGLIVYPAGCVVVVYNPRKNKQTYISNASRKTITTLSISLDGRHVVTGECGHQPHVRVWDIQEKVQVAEFSGHKFGINCVAFSPNLKYVVSVGSQHDMIVNVWDWRNNIKVASNKVSSKVKAVAFSEDGDHFVTVGNRHVKFWYLDYFRSTKYKEPVPLMGRSAILGEQRNNYFCDVACGCGDAADSTFAITKSGLLCEFNSRRLLDKWVELRASANCLNVGLEYIFIGCADGIVRCFNPYTLDFVTTLPRTHHLGVDIAKCVTLGDMASHPKSAKYPDTIAIALDEINRKVTCIYNDHSLYVWDIKDIRTVGKSHSFLFHSACIWGVEMYPEDAQSYLPAGSFVTCSSDDTIRIWKLDHCVNNSPNNKLYPKNVYCPDLLKILYIDDELNYLCESDRSLSASGTEKAETTYDGRNGVRCLKISPDGTHLASGDRSGNIRIHGVQFMDELMKIEAHDSEVLCLEYSKLPTDHRYLASASRDRLIHVFDVNHDYSFLQTLDDHSSSITAVRFVQQQDNFQMISCGADKSVIFRGAQFTPQLQFIRNHHVVGKTTLYDMDVDTSQKHILTACQDRNIRVYNINNGKHSRTFKGSQGEDGTLIKVVLDNSGLYVATSSTDKNLCIYDFYSGECVATMYGHSEIVTGFRFTNDGKQLISVSGDGCIFVWRLPPEMTHSIQLHTAQLKSLAKAKQGAVRGVFEVPQPLIPAREFNFDVYNANEEDDPSYRFSVGPLPLWAKKQISDDVALKDAGKAPNVAQPKGRWAQRVEKQGINVKSFYETGHVIPCPLQSYNDSKSFDASPEPEFSYKSGRREAVAKFQNVDQSSLSFEEFPASLSEIRMGNAPSQTPAGMINTKRGGTEYSPSRARSLTESSSMSIDDYDIEGDGDVADDETESNEPDLQEIIYYPPLDESSHSADFSEFKVCNTNLDDLREAHRRNKKAKSERPNDIPLLQIQGVRSTDSEEDEEVTTPQNADQTIFNTFSMSTESLDMVGQRERFMKSNFENLDVGKTDDETENNDNRLSITSRFLSKTPDRKNFNDKKSEKDVPPSPKRLESMKRIEETRRKLDTIGWKASLNSSRSSTDLTYIPEKDFAGRPIAVNKGIALLRNANILAGSMPDLSDTDHQSASTTFNQHGNFSSSPPSSPRTNTLPRSQRNRSGVNGVGIPCPSSPVHNQRNNINSKSDLRQRCLQQPFAKKLTIHQVLPSKCDSGNSGNIWRTSSMIDLSAKAPRRVLPSRPNTVTSKNATRRNSAYSAPVVDSGNILRSSSMTTLAGVGDEDSRLMRATISSKNKMKANQPNDAVHRPLPKSASSSSLAASRRELTLAGSGTSSGDTSPVDGSNEHPIRTRSTSMDRGSSRPPRPEPKLSLPSRPNGTNRSSLSSAKWTSERNISRMNGDHRASSTMSANITVTKTSKHEVHLKQGTTTTSTTRKALVVAARSTSISQGNGLDKSPEELPVKDNISHLDVVNAPLTRDLCDTTVEDLKHASDNILQLYKRITMDCDLPDDERIEMLNSLSLSVVQAQETLRPIRSVPSGGHPDLVQVTGGQKVPDGPGVVEMSRLLEQYSHRLIDLVQQGMSTQPGST